MIILFLNLKLILSIKNWMKFDIFDLDYLQLLVFIVICIEETLILKKLIFYDFRESSFTLYVFIIFSSPILKISHQMIQLLLSLPDYTLHILILDTILLYGVLNVIEMRLEGLESVLLFLENLLLLLALQI